MKKIYKSIFFYGLLATTSLIMGSCGDAFDYPDWQIIDDKQSDTSGGDELIWEMFLMRYWKENYAKQWNM